MSIADIRNGLLLPERETIINKYFELEGRPTVLASITEQDGEVKVWMFHRADFSGLDITEWAADEPVFDSNRAKKIAEIESHRIISIDVLEFEIQGNLLRINASSYGPVEYMEHGLMKLQHFLESGIDLSPLEDTSFNELCLYEYRVEEGTPFPDIDTTQPIPAGIRIFAESRETLISPPQKFQLCIGEYPFDTAHFFSNPATGENIEFFIDRLISYDTRANTKAQFEDEANQAAWRKQGLDEAAIAEMQSHISEVYEILCPEGHELLLIQYESPSDVQLKFYATEYLDEAPEYKSSGVVGFIIESEEKSKYGFHVRTDILVPVPKGFADTIEVELFSWYQDIPAMEINLG